MLHTCAWNLYGIFSSFRDYTLLWLMLAWIVNPVFIVFRILINNWIETSIICNYRMILLTKHLSNRH